MQTEEKFSFFESPTSNHHFSLRKFSSANREKFFFFFFKALLQMSIFHYANLVMQAEKNFSFFFKALLQINIFHYANLVMRVEEKFSFFEILTPNHNFSLRKFSNASRGKISLF